MKTWMGIALGVAVLAGGFAVSAAQRGSRESRWLESMDTDGDGKISREEWTTYYSERFTQSDANEDGFITADEMRTFSRGSRGGREGRGEGREE